MNTKELIQSLQKAETQLLTGIKQSQQLTSEEKQMLVLFYTHMKYSVEIKQMEKKYEEFLNENQLQMERNSTLQNEIDKLQVIIDNEKRKKDDALRKKKLMKLELYNEKEDLEKDIELLDRKIEIVKEDIEKAKKEVEMKEKEATTMNEDKKRIANEVDDIKKYFERIQDERIREIFDGDKKQYHRQYYANRNLTRLKDEIDENEKKKMGKK